MAAARRGERAGPPAVLELDAASGVDKNTIYRAIKNPPEDPPYNPGLDKLEKLAGAYDLSAWALLLPNLDPVKKPIASTQEQRDADVEARAEALSHTLLASAILEKKLKKNATPGRRRGVKPAAARPAAKEKPAGRKLAVRK